MNTPLISVITPNFNSGKFILRTIESVQNQTYKNWEWLIIDDCSTDNSVEIIEKFTAIDSRIQLIKLEQNSGPAICRNTGIEMAKGSFMTFIDSDDLWKPNFIEISIKQEQESEGFVFASYHCYDENLNPKFNDFIVPNKVTYDDILKQNSISCLTAFINIEKLGKYKMPEVRYRQDMGLWLQYLKLIEYAVGIKEPLAIYRIREKSHSRNKFKLLKHQWNFYRNVEGISFIKTTYYFSIWMYCGIKKYYG
ncbi:glycosyltransferase family 2 protein [Lutibacter sp.]|uniref:glycosyltransferase family 2 protein n=1 Tax=Lutibacter sp. TaxID=1925666 RepID=UPI003567A478